MSPPEEGFSVTVSSQVAVWLPSSVVTVMVAFPAATALTTPLETVATLLLLVDQVMFLLVASLGRTVAVRVTVSPTLMLAVVLSSLTPVTGTTELFSTVTVLVAVYPPSSVVTVMTAVPSLIPVTTPFLSTEAIEESLEDQETFWLVAL